MRVSQRVDYALRGLVALAQRTPGTSVAAGDIADELGLPRRFLEQQFTALAQAGILECRRGAGGGCSMARPAAMVTAADVVRALEGTSLDVPRTSGTVVSDMWADVAHALDEALDGVNLADLAGRQNELDASAAAVYYI